MLIIIITLSNHHIQNQIVMNQSKVIPCIVSLSKLIALTIDNYFINYETLKKSTRFYEYEQLQIKIHSLREQLINGFPWYCGSSMEIEEKKLNTDFFNSEKKNPFKQEHKLLKLALKQNQTICKGIVANKDYKQLFTEIENACKAQLKITDEVLEKAKTKHQQSHFIPKYIKRRDTKTTYAG